MEQNTPRNFALQLGSLIALYTSISALILVLFGVINVMYPDPINGYWGYESAQQSIRFGIAMLLVFFPTYIAVTRYANVVRRKEAGTYLTLTKWLVYLSLLIGGLILLGDFVTVILTYLNGEITVRFLLKALALSIIIGAAFYYYILDARGYWLSHEKESKMYAAGAAVIVIGVLGLGFLNSQTPSEVRESRLDSQQISDLNDMQWRIEDHFRVEGSLPADVSVLYIGIEVPIAEEGREPYGYRIIDEDTYELCATFAFPSQSNEFSDHSMLRQEDMKNPYNNWDHGAGRTCFERTAVPERLPI